MQVPLRATQQQCTQCRRQRLIVRSATAVVVNVVEGETQRPSKYLSREYVTDLLENVLESENGELGIKRSEKQQ